MSLYIVQIKLIFLHFKVQKYYLAYLVVEKEKKKRINQPVINKTYILINNSNMLNLKQNNIKDILQFFYLKQQNTFILYFLINY